MNKIINFAAIGGDLRQVQVINSIAATGHKISVYGFEKCEANAFAATVKRCDSVSAAVNAAEIVILPLPCTTDGVNVNAPFCEEKLLVEAVISAVKLESRLLIGKIDAWIQDLCDARGIDCTDYFDREELVVANAVPIE